MKIVFHYSQFFRIVRFIILNDIVFQYRIFIEIQFIAYKL